MAAHTGVFCSHALELLCSEFHACPSTPSLTWMLACKHMPDVRA